MKHATRATRPSAESWKLWDKDTVETLIEVIDELIANRQVRQVEIARQLGTAPSQIQRWREGTSHWGAIGESKYADLVEYLRGRRLLPIAPSGITAAEYRGLASLMGQTDDQLKWVKDNAQGDYRAYRWSNAKRGSVLCGRLTIAYNPTLQVVETREDYTAVIDKERVSWPRSGYFVGRGEHGYSIFSRKLKSNEVQIAHLRPPMPRRTTEDFEGVSRFEGIVCDMQGGTVYKTPIILQKVKTRVTDKEIRDFIPKTRDEIKTAKSLSELIAFDGTIARF